MKIKKFSAALGAALALSAAGLANAPQASADATACAYSSSNVGDTCLYITGTNNVTSATVWGTSNRPHYTCGFRAKLTGTAYPLFKTATSYSAYSSTCSWYPLKMIWYPGTSYKSGTKVIGQYYYNGSWQPGKPSITVWA